MARNKMTEEEKAARAIVLQEKRVQENLDNTLKSLRRGYTSSPTVFYKVGELVLYGAHPNARVLEIYDDGKFLRVALWGDHPVYGKMTYYESAQIVSWVQIKKFRTAEEDAKIPVFTQTKNYHLEYSQRSMYDIFSKVNLFGLDLSPTYQRGNVWDTTDKIALLDSIFAKVDIGKFVFIRLPFRDAGLCYEVLDGKQRITTIMEFYENRLRYRGFLFGELSWKDQSTFKNYTISYAELNNPCLEEKLEYFLRLNTGGKVVDPEHIKHVENYLRTVKNGEVEGC